MRRGASGSLEAAVLAAEGMARGHYCSGDKNHDDTVKTHSIAVDLGAAPGGWSAELARTHGIVFAVDPADLNLAALPSNVVHVRSRALDAVLKLLAAGLRERVATLVCDANVPCEAAAQWVIDATPLLSPGATIILSAKNFDGSAFVWKNAVMRLEALLASVGFVNVQRVHLFANGPQEVTVIGFWKS